MWIDAGSRYEDARSNGAAHFLEHMAFKGTRRRNRTALEQEIENMGGHLNAYTSREQTVYYAKGFKNDLRQIIDILGDILQNSNIDSYHLEIERAVIIREMEEVMKQTEEVIFDNLHTAAYRDSPLGYTILGPVENINSLNRDQLRSYIETHYSSDRMVFVAAGDVKHEEVVRLVSEIFGGLRPSRVMETLLANKPYFCGTELIQQSDELGSSAHVAVAYEGVPWNSPDAIPFMLLQSLFGTYQRDQGVIPGSLSDNKLIRSVAELDGQPCESFTSYNTCYKDTGLFGWYVVCDADAARACVERLLIGAANIGNEVTEEELDRAKHHLRMSLFGALDGTTAIAEDVGRQLLVYGRRMTAPEFCLRVAAVTVDDVRRCAKQHFCDANIALTGLGRVEGLPPRAVLQPLTRV
jgi:processing peptidase subunit beta